MNRTASRAWTGIPGSWSRCFPTTWRPCSTAVSGRCPRTPRDAWCGPRARTRSSPSRWAGSQSSAAGSRRRSGMPRSPGTSIDWPRTGVGTGRPGSRGGDPRLGPARPTTSQLATAPGSAERVALGLRNAEQAGVLELRGDVWSFTHPLLAAAVYAALQPQACRARRYVRGSRPRGRLPDRVERERRRARAWARSVRPRLREPQSPQEPPQRRPRGPRRSRRWIPPRRRARRASP